MVFKKSPFTTLLVFIAIGSASLFVGCAEPNGSEGGSGVASASKGLALKYPGGMTTIPLANVVDVEITVFPPMMNPNTNHDSRTFTGPAAAKFLESAGLASAKEARPSNATKTGYIVVSFKNGNDQIEKRTFNILNERFLEDATFPEIIYRGDLIFDRYWLDGLPSSP